MANNAGVEAFSARDLAIKLGARIAPHIKDEQRSEVIVALYEALQEESSSRGVGE